MIISNKNYILIRPKVTSNLIDEFNSCLKQISDILEAHSNTTDYVIKQTIFIKAENNSEYVQRSKLLTSKLEEFYGEIPPPISIIGQPPENGYECVMELILLYNNTSDYSLKRKRLENITYSVIEYNETKEVFAGGLSSSLVSDSYCPLNFSRNAFKLMENILEAEQLSFSDIVRQWNYVEGILEKQTQNDGVRQNYQIFNDVRSVYYAKSDFNNGYPAATGIGMSTGGIILDFIALKPNNSVNIIPIKNPRQIDAHQYSEEVLVGKPIEEITQKTSPKFERAKFTSISNIGQIYVSGTAAILGQKSESAQAIKEQTVTTIENIENLISQSNLYDHDIKANSRPLKLTYLRAYIKDEKDVEIVKDICEKYYPDLPAVYLISDICRDDLLVELEGVAEWG